MKRKNVARNALFTSVISLLLCVSMLVGTTFAWFTDEVKSGVNTIAAGNLDVELYHGKNANPVDKVKNDTLLFTDAGGKVIDLWEPGVVAFTNLKVANEGTLALKYQLSINSTEMNTVKDTELTLADALKVAVVEGGVSGTREQVIGAVADNAWTKLESFTLPGVLEAEKKSETYGIVIYWQPGDNAVDNQFNMNNGKTTSNGKPLTITLGVNLFATQEMYEDDSFGPDYDEDGWVDGFDVYTAQDLNAAIANGETAIDLMGDINLTETLEIPEGAKLTLNLNGKTLTGSGRDNEDNKVHALTNNGSLKLGGGTVKSEAANGGSAIYNAAGATLTLEDVTVVGAPQDANNTGAWPSYAINNYGGMTIKGADITSAHGAISVYGDTVIEDANVTVNGRGGSSHVFYIGGEGTDLIVHGGTYTHKGNTDGSLAYIMTGTTMTVNGGTFTASNGGYGLATYTGSLTVNGGTFTNAFQDWGGPITISGGTFATKPDDKYIADGFAATQNADGTYTVGFPQESLDDLIENAGENDTINVPAGEYTFPASELKAGQTLNCAPGTVFEGKTSLNINGATVVGATFTSADEYLVKSQTINGIFKDCVFTNSDGLRSCIAGENVVFENCVFDTDFYGVHFDSGANDVAFKNCTFSGFNTFGSALTKLTMENCTFKYNGKGGYNGANLWGDTEMTNCTFVFDGTAGNEWVDLRGDNKTVTFTNCVVTDGKTEKGIDTVVGDYGTGNSVIINGVPMVFSNAGLQNAVNNGVNYVLLADGEYDLNGIQKDGLTLVGAGSAVKMANTTKYANNKATGAIWQAINLKNMTITNTVYTMADGGDASFEDVTFAAGFRQGYGTAVKFNNCTFGSNSEGYALHFQTDSASEGGKIVLNGCEFEGGKVHLGGKRTYEFTGCDFVAGTDFQVWSDITLENCTVAGEKITADNMATAFPKLDAAKVTVK